MKNLITLALVSLAAAGCSSHSEPIISNESLMTSHIECSYHYFIKGKISMAYDTINCEITERSGFINRDVCWDLSLTCEDNSISMVHTCGQAIAGKTTYYTVYVSDFDFYSCNRFINMEIINYH